MKEKKEEFNFNIEEMIKSGLHFGHLVSKTHPKMKPFIFGARNGVHLINLEKTREKLSKALFFLKEIVDKKKNFILLGTKIQVKDLIKETGEKLNLPYVTERWIGGTITNFSVIKKRIEYFKNLQKKKENGEFEKYTKKERAKIDKELKELNKKFGGIKNLNELPEALFILNLKENILAAKEAKSKDIKVVAVVDTDCDPSFVDYPIPANDDALFSIKYIIDNLIKIIKKDENFDRTN